MITQVITLLTTLHKIMSSQQQTHCDESQQQKLKIGERVTAGNSMFSSDRMPYNVNPTPGVDVIQRQRQQRLNLNIKFIDISYNLQEYFISYI